MTYQRAGGQDTADVIGNVKRDAGYPRYPGQTGVIEARMVTIDDGFDEALGCAGA